MPDRTKQLVDALLKAPGMLELLKRDPAQIVTALANCEQGQAMIKAGTRAIGEVLDRFAGGSRPQAGRASPVESAGVVAPAVPEASSQSGNSSLAIVGVTSLAAIAGSLALLGTVSMVALNRRDS